MTEELVKCINCDEELDLDHDDYDWTEDGPLCWGCYEVESEHASTLLHFGIEGIGKYYIADHFVRDEWGEDAKEWVRERLQPRAWHSTDGWRGYYDTKPQDGYVVLAEGWATGRYSDVRYKHRINDLGEWLPDHVEEVPGEGLYVLLEHTSNVFSLATTIICAESDADAIVEFLSDNGFSVEVLESALG